MHFKMYLQIILSLLVLPVADAFEKIYKSERPEWLSMEIEYGCQVKGTQDFMSFGFDSAFLPGVQVAYWQPSQGGKEECADLKCPPGYSLLWKKSFYKSDFAQQSVKFNGMTLELKWDHKNESYLGDIRFFESSSSTLHVQNARSQRAPELNCFAEPKSSSVEVVEIVKKWKVDLCEEEKKEEEKAARIFGPSLIGSGGTPPTRLTKSRKDKHFLQ